MRNFFILWAGQLVSSIGSKMSSFAIAIWAWEFTGKATTLTLVGFFSTLASMASTPLSGVIVDRFNRKLLFIVGDTVALIAIIIIMMLYLANNLQIWHLYLISAIVSVFNQLQSLAYSASVSLLIPKKHYTRASSLQFLLVYGSSIIAPALSGYLYEVIGLLRIWLIDISTLAVAISSLLFVRIPKPPQTNEHENPGNIWQDLKFGLRYIFARKSLSALLAITFLFQFAHDIGASLYSPMILSRTGNDALVLGSLASAAGFGGITGAIIISSWGGFKQNIKGFLLGMIGAGLSKIVFGLGRTAWIWIPSQFCSSLNFPFKGASGQAIWLAKVAPSIQGRVFAINSLVLQFASAFAYLIAGLLADKVFTPALTEGGYLVGIFEGIFGTGTGAGIALLYVISALCMFLIGIIGFYIPLLQNLERILPDYDAESSQFSSSK